MLSLRSASTRLFLSFFALGTLNNVLYVIILSAALDLVGAKTPKAVVLLASILPTVAVKATAPFVSQYVTYTTRIATVVGLNLAGMLLIGGAGTLGVRVAGICLTSAAGGAGEITFLQLGSQYPETALAAWSSGTGGAGLLGGLIYTIATTWLRFSPSSTMLACAVLPLAMAAVFYTLPKPPAGQGAHPQQQYAPIVAEEMDDREMPPPQYLAGDTTAVRKGFDWDKVLPLVMPFMVPLFLVYWAEYTINSGVAPTLMFPLEEMPFQAYRDVYPTYAVLYQAGVFISRSSSPFIRVRDLLPPALIQCGFLALSITQSITVFIPNIWPIFLLSFSAGILGGLVYVNAMHNCAESSAILPADREFSIGVISVADSIGILTAALVSLWLEPALCQYAVARGRPYCTYE